MARQWLKKFAVWSRADEEDLAISAHDIKTSRHAVVRLLACGTDGAIRVRIAHLPRIRNPFATWEDCNDWIPPRIDHLAQLVKRWRGEPRFLHASVKI